MAAVPDFGVLASQQNQANNQATQMTNAANRPNQFNALGSTTWQPNPDGGYNQWSTLNGGAQGLFDTSMSGQTNLAGQVGQGLDYSSLGQMPQVGGYNQDVINSWNALQKPGLDQQAEAQRARAAAMGITIGSNANNDIERTIGNNWSDASNKAILAGYTQGNTEFGQALQARQQGATELQNKFGAAQSGMSALTGVRDSLNVNKWNTDVPQSAAYVPQTIYGAAQDTFNANRMNENADIAQRNTNVSQGIGAASALLGNQGAGGLLSGAGSALGSLWGSNTGLFGGGDASLWNQWTGTGSYNYDTLGLGMNSPAYQDNSSFWGGYGGGGS